MTKCTTCGVFQNRLQRGKLCDTCYQKNNNNSLINMDSTASQRQQNQMSQSTRISASNGFSSDLSSPLSSMNNNEIWFNDQVQNLQQQRFRPPQAENSVMNSSLLTQPGMQARFRPPQGGMPSSMSKSNFTPNQHDMSAIQEY